MKGFIKFLIALLVIVVILAIAFVVLINLTPRQLHLENVAIGGKTIDELGIADTKIINIYKSIKSIGKAKESDVVHNGINEEEDSASAKENTKGSTIANADDYSSVVTTPVVYDARRLVSYDDTTIAYILNNIVQNAKDDSSAEIKALKDAKIEVKELTIIVDSEGARMRVVSYMDLSSYEGQIKEALGAAANILPIPKQAYLVSEISFTVETNALSPSLGKLVTAPISISVNGNNDDPVSQAILEVMSSMAGGESIDSLNGKLGEAISQVVGNLGQVGTATTVGDTNVIVPLSENYGMSGVASGTLTLITYAAV